MSILRNALAGEVALSIAGLPSGMTATFDPAATTGNTSTLTISVGASVVPTAHTLTVTGTATDVGPRTATLTVTVEEKEEPDPDPDPDPDPSTGNTVWQFCPSYGLPVWFAFQDGDGPWTRVTGANHRYAFDIQSARGGVAFVTVGGTTNLFVYHGTQQELNTFGNDLCNGSPVGKTIHGTVANLGTTGRGNHPTRAEPIRRSGAGGARLRRR